MQTVTYFRYQKDGWMTKSIVIACCAMNAGITIFIWVSGVIAVSVMY